MPFIRNMLSADPAYAEYVSDAGITGNDDFDIVGNFCCGEDHQLCTNFPIVSVMGHVFLIRLLVRQHSAGSCSILVTYVNPCAAQQDRAAWSSQAARFCFGTAHGGIVSTVESSVLLPLAACTNSCRSSSNVEQGVYAPESTFSDMSGVDNT